MNKYCTGVGWFALSLMASVINDVISKYLGLEIHPFEVSFFRFLCSVIILIPFIVSGGSATLRTSSLAIHGIRGLILFLGITGWTYGLAICNLATATLMSFTIPLFTLVLAQFFLNENIIWQRWFATILGFFGVAIAIGAVNSKLELGALVFTCTAIGFASLDIINKKFIVRETMVSMLFYSAVVTSILSFVPAMLYWQTPTWYQMSLFFILGVSANLILFFLLKAFSILDASAVAPYRYLELFISAFVGYYLFNETPGTEIIYGACIVVPCTLFVVYSEKKE